MTRAIVGLRGLIATARRPLELPFIPTPGTTLVYGAWSLPVTEVIYDVEERRAVINVDDDRTLARPECWGTGAVAQALARYTADGWHVTTASAR